ncbi:MAG: glycerol-3-phosphate acyltransferase, partial [Pseudomonadota bacterium]
TRSGVTQAFFPEGGLSLDGHLAPPKMGLLSYAIETHRAGGARVVFVPVGINYDRVLEDRILIAAKEEGGRRFRARISVVFWFFLRKLWQRLRGRFVHFGTAAVVYGAPLDLADYRDDTPVDAIATDLMAGIARAMPVLAVPVLAQIFIEAEGPLAPGEIESRAKARVAAMGAPLLGEGEAWIEEALDRLRGRKLIAQRDGLWAAVEAERTLLAYYGASLGEMGEMARAAQ